ncbi:MAG: hypothetical protein ABI901_13970 [Roseiflexaceae bacterium]
MLAWEVVTNKGNAEVEVCDAMLDHRATLLKRTRRVIFLANCGFRDRAWACKCRMLGWNYIIRIANNTTITFPGEVVAAADALGVKHGEWRYLTNVRVTLEADWDCNLALTWTRATPTCPAELCVVG